jgi:hypothetical protein
VQVVAALPEELAPPEVLFAAAELDPEVEAEEVLALEMEAAPVESDEPAVEEELAVEAVLEEQLETEAELVVEEEFVVAAAEVEVVAAVVTEVPEIEEAPVEVADVELADDVEVAIPLVVDPLVPEVLELPEVVAAEWLIPVEVVEAAAEEKVEVGPAGGGAEPAHPANAAHPTSTNEHLFTDPPASLATSK